MVGFVRLLGDSDSARFKPVLVARQRRPKPTSAQEVEPARLLAADTNEPQPGAASIVAAASLSVGRWDMGACLTYDTSLIMQ